MERLKLGLKGINTSEITENVSFFDVIRKENIEQVQLLIKSGYDINIKGNNGESAIHVASSVQNVEILQYLLQQQNIDKDALDSNGSTALVDACRMNACTKVIETLLYYGCDPNITSHCGLYAMNYAIRVGNEAVVRLLIDHGANINSFGGKLETPFMTALWSDRVNILAMLLYYNVDTTIYYKFDIRGLLDTAAPTPWIVINESKGLLNLLLPYINMRDLHLLITCDIPVLRKIWNAQDKRDKLAFTSWCLEGIDTDCTNFQTNIKTVVFVLIKKDLASTDCPGSFFHELFQQEELYELMYYPKTSTYFLSALGDGIHFNYVLKNKNFTESVFADCLRLLLCNYNELNDLSTLGYMPFILHPSATLAVLEDMNVKVTEAGINEVIVQWRCSWWKSDTIIEEVKALARRAFKPGELVVYDAVCVEVLHLKVKYVNTDTRKPCSLVELSRNVARESIRSTDEVTNYDKSEYFPFQYASDIKSLQVPKILHDILLFRRPIY